MEAFIYFIGLISLILLIIIGSMLLLYIRNLKIIVDTEKELARLYKFIFKIK